MIIDIRCEFSVQAHIINFSGGLVSPSDGWKKTNPPPTFMNFPFVMGTTTSVLYYILPTFTMEISSGVYQSSRELVFHKSFPFNRRYF